MFYREALFQNIYLVYWVSRWQNDAYKTYQSGSGYSIKYADTGAQRGVQRAQQLPMYRRGAFKELCSLLLYFRGAFKELSSYKCTSDERSQSSTVCHCSSEERSKSSAVYQCISEERSKSSAVYLLQHNIACFFTNKQVMKT